MNFITIDFETATAKRDSPCEIGLTFVKDGTIIETKSWLIKPFYEKFDYFNMQIHGIKPEDVINELEFNDLWIEIRPLIENQFLIAHNASFDFSVLRRTLEAYSIPFPTLNYSCSYQFSKKIWVGLPSYDLKSLCKLNNIGFIHHRAGSDSRATAELALKAFEFANIKTLEDFSNKLFRLASLNDGRYTPIILKEQLKIIGDESRNNQESIFYKKIIVFTGTLTSMVRAEAQKIIADIGGILGNGVTKETDFLIVGQQEFRVVGDVGMSSKQEKAIKLIEKGSKLEILSESIFLENL